MNYKSRCVVLRENPETCRAGLKWTENENADLMKRAIDKMNIDDIAKAHMRTVLAVKSRIMSNALKIMADQNMTLEQISTYVNVSIQDLEEFIKKNKLWTIEEENNLIEEIKTLDICKIAEIHQRTIGAIRSRLRHIRRQEDTDKTKLNVQDKLWTIEEENNLIEEIKTLDICKIAEIHQRTEYAIRSRLRHIRRQEKIKLNIQDKSWTSEEIKTIA